MVCSKLGGGCWALYHLRKIVDHQTLKMVYHSLIHSHLNYCISSLGGTPVFSLLPLDRMQKKAVRIITDSNTRTHTKPLFSNRQILKLNDIYKLEIAKLMHKINHKSSSSCKLNPFMPSVLYIGHLLKLKLRFAHPIYGGKWTCNASMSIFFANFIFTFEKIISG